MIPQHFTRHTRAFKYITSSILNPKFVSNQNPKLRFASTIPHGRRQLSLIDYATWGTISFISLQVGATIMHNILKPDLSLENDLREVRREKGLITEVQLVDETTEMN